MKKQENNIILDIPFEISKVIKYISHEFVKSWLSYLTVDDFQKISDEIWVDINTLKQIYWNQKYRKAIETYIISLKKNKTKEKQENIKMIDNKEISVQDEFFVDIENTNQFHLKTWNIDIHLSNKLFSLYDLLNEERLYLLQFQKKWLWTSFWKYIEERIQEIKKIRKKINHVLWSVTKI